MNINKNLWSSLSMAAILLTAFLAVLSIKTIKEIGYVGHGTDATSMISVDGSGDAVSAPDIATFSFTVNENAKTVADAQTKATTKTNAALKAVRDAGIADKDIQTQSYNINPHYEYQSAVCPAYSSSSAVSYCPGGKSILTGYDVSQTIQIKVRDLSKAGAIFSTIGALEVENVNGLTFAVDKPEAVQAEARAKAIAAAQAKAESLAKQLGVKLVRIISFSENNSVPRALMYSMDSKVMSSAGAVAVPEVPAGEQKITSNVSISYEIR